MLLVLLVLVLLLLLEQAQPVFTASQALS